MSQMASQSNIEDDFTSAAFLVEKELGVELTPEYPALKFVTQLEEITKYYKKQNEEMERTKSMRGKSFR